MWGHCTRWSAAYDLLFSIEMAAPCCDETETLIKLSLLKLLPSKQRKKHTILLQNIISCQRYLGMFPGCTPPTRTSTLVLEMQHKHAHVEWSAVWTSLSAKLFQRLSEVFCVLIYSQQYCSCYERFCLCRFFLALELKMFV